jgi:uncharacterized protein (TIGR02646 family)
MRYIPLNENPPSKEWIDKANKVTQRLIAENDPKKRKKIIDDNDHLWGGIKSHLLNLSHRKCWYSESRDVYSHYHVDHFRPKKRAFDLAGIDQGGYWWLAFEWTNYRICGSVGNSKKGDKFCVFRNKSKLPNDPIEDEIIYLLDPTDPDDPLKLSFDEFGDVHPLLIDKEDWDYKRAKYTIDSLDLNYEPLKDRRKDLWDTCQSKLNELKNLMQEYKQTQSVSKKAQIKLKMEELRKFAKAESELSAVAVGCFLSSRDEWVQKLALSA